MSSVILYTGKFPEGTDYEVTPSQCLKFFQHILPASLVVFIGSHSVKNHVSCVLLINFLICFNLLLDLPFQGEGSSVVVSSMLSLSIEADNVFLSQKGINLLIIFFSALSHNLLKDKKRIFSIN